MSKKILSVGQCNRDHGLLTTFAERCSAGATLVRVNTKADALQSLQQEKYDLIWINRMFDADNSYGVELIKAVTADPKLAGAKMMLVSNFPEAQQEAQQLGALQGFGKDYLEDAATIARVRAVLQA